MNHNYWIIEQKKSTTPTNSHKKMGFTQPQNSMIFLATNSHKFSQINHCVGLQQNTDLIHLNRAYTQIENSV